MFGKDLLIKKFPYLGFSPNIMEYFCIIGYQENFIPILISSLGKKRNAYSPTVLSSITSNIDYGIIDNELIISQIYPDNPIIIPFIKNENNNIINENPPTSNVIYSFCFDTPDGKSKLFYTCFAFKFYEKYSQKTNSGIDEYYIPKALCIISQYSFFTLFEYICNNIYKLLSKKEKCSVPVELLIYNIVNFIPSPMSYNLHLDIFSFCMNVPDVEINQLSGYPYVDFDLKEIFNILPLNFFLEVYILTIIEQSMLFFSSNLELLNMVMFIMYILNYPCNDSTYFWHIVSVSKDNLVEENKFVGKMMVFLLGVNASYDDSIDTSPFGKYHFIVDIDNKKIFLRESLNISIDEKEESTNLNKFQQYIQNIIKEKNIESSFLKIFIIKLKKGLENLLFKDQEQHSNAKVKNSNFNFFKMTKAIYKTNKKIQELFYEFCLNILMIFYQDNALISSFDKISRVECSLEEQNKRINYLKINDSNIDISQDEKNFLEFFRGSIKYKIYFDNFIQSMDMLDVFKISLLFSEEFINIKMKDPKNKILNKISLFQIIDALYYPPKQQTINITISNLFSLSLDKLQTYFEEYYNKNDNNLKPKLIDLNKKIINKYIFLLNNFYEKEEIIDLFPSIRIQEEQPIILFDRRYIINIIQNHFENKNLISTTDYLMYAVVYIFCISIPLFSYNNLILHLKSIVKKTLGSIKFFLRKFGYIILQTFFKYLSMNKEDEYSEITLTKVKMYYLIIIDFLKENKIIPNEEMMAIFTKFFGKMIYQERFVRKAEEKENKEIDKDIDFKLVRNKNYLCFMKHCFSNKKYYNSTFMINSGLKEYNICNIIIKTNMILKPTVEIKIKDYIYSTQFFSPKKIFKLTELSFNDLYENENLDFSKLKIKNVRDCIANLIQYGIEKEEIPVDFLLYTLYLLRNYENKFIQKTDNDENKELIINEQEH